MLGTRNVAALIIVLIGSASSPAQSRVLSFDERVASQKAIEQVYWNHRIWPTENPGPKPPLAAVMPDAAIRAKVIDYLKKTNALETRWQRPVDAEQLQAELNRMAIGTKDAQMLRELYRALGNDPFVIAETLARQTLVDRLIRARYSSDTRFHGEVKAKAEAALAACTIIDCMKTTDAEYFETTWKQEDDSAEEWTSRLDRLGTVFGMPSTSLHSGRLSPLEETAEAFVVTVVLAQRDDELKTASVAWPKRSFDAWWSEERVRTSANTMAAAGEYAIATPTGGSCVNDTWQGRFYAPSWRYLHTAVWTGTEMIMWGGFDYSTSLNTGGRYNPATDSWTATSTGANVPSKTRAHTAVWTGTEMIVWGGYDGSVALNKGGRYNPTTDSWLATSTGTNVPTARASNSTIWTGVEMIVWGGLDSASTPNSNTGGRYDAATDSWTATSTGANAPSARRSHSAVWTGAEMIVWAGAPININLGLYCGCTQATYYRDVDGDSYGNASVSISACEGSPPTGYVADDTDCNDASASIHPGVAESCNGLDDDCDFTIDNGGAALCSDGNGCTDDACNGGAGCGHVNNTAPCDDGNACTTGDACAGGACSGIAVPVPGDVSSVLASKSGATATYDWSATAGATTYDMLRGRVLNWPVGSNPATETCFDDVAVTTTNDATVPPVGDGYWYLVRAENACGIGGFGSQAVHGLPTVPRLSGTCP